MSSSKTLANNIASSSLLNKPSSASTTHTEKVEREQTQHTSASKDLFLLNDKTFTQQFSKLYAHRIKTMKPALLKKISKMYPNATTAKSMLDLTMGVEYTVAGTLYKEMKLKPNILREFTTEKNFEAEKVELLDNFVSDSDYLILEDLNGSRCNVVFESKNSEKNRLMTSQLVTGIIAGLYGQIDSSGTFIAKDIVFNDPPPQRSITVPQKDAYLAVISGVCVGHPKYDVVATQMAFDFINGLAGSGAFVNDVAAKISRVIIAGNGVIAAEDEGKRFDVRGSLRPKELSSIAGHMKSFDGLVEQLVNTVDVDVMPGPNDPSNVTIPQQPIHPFMLQRSSPFSTCRLVTNPHLIQENGLDVFVTSGQTVAEIEKYSTYSSRLEVMKNLLQWGHYAPSAPDTMRCYPFKDTDPFIMKHTPHIMICGNCPKFETTLVTVKETKSRLVCVPEFVSCPTIVLINLKTLDCVPINFSTENVV